MSVRPSLSICFFFLVHYGDPTTKIIRDHPELEKGHGASLDVRPPRTRRARYKPRERKYKRVSVRIVSSPRVLNFISSPNRSPRIALVYIKCTRQGVYASTAAFYLDRVFCCYYANNSGSLRRTNVAGNRSGGGTAPLQRARRTLEIRSTRFDGSSYSYDTIRCNREVFFIFFF